MTACHPSFWHLQWKSENPSVKPHDSPLYTKGGEHETAGGVRGRRRLWMEEKKEVRKSREGPDMPLDNSRYHKYYACSSGGHDDQHSQEQRPRPCRSRLAEYPLHFFVRRLLRPETRAISHPACNE